MNHFTILKNKIKQKKAIICVIGLGYVGIPLIKSFSRKGFKTIGIDKDLKKKNILNKVNNSIFLQIIK